MIPLATEHIFSIYIIIWFTVFFILWFREDRRCRRASEWFVVKERLYTCNHCHYSFLAKHNREMVTRCPRCNSICFLRKRKRF